jgi:hypothetical protein
MLKRSYLREGDEALRESVGRWSNGIGGEALSKVKYDIKIQGE